MASVHRRPGTPYWFGAFRQGGKLVFRSTKVENRAAAERITLEWERAAQLAMRGDLTEAQSRDVLAGIMARAGLEETIRSCTAEDFFGQWIEAKGASKATATLSRYAKPVKLFVASLGPKAKRPLGSVTAADVERFLTSRLKSGVSQSTARLDTKIVRMALKRATDQGLISKNPATGVELPDKDGVERGTFSPVEIAQLIAAAPPEWGLLIRIAFYSGQRLSDCAGLAWEQIDLTAGTVRFQQGKTGLKVLIPLHPDLRAALEAIAGDLGGPVLPSLSQTSKTGRKGLSEVFKGIVRAAGLDLGEVQGGGQRKTNTRTFHSLRHSFTSALANAGVAQEVRMKLTGHKSPDIHRAYSHHELETLRGGIAKLPELPALPAAAPLKAARKAASQV